MTSPKAYDWEQIQIEYRTGTASVRSIAVAHGISETAIRKRATKEGWTKDLKGEVNARAEDLVRKAEVRGSHEVRTETEQTEVEVSATIKANVILAHRTDVSRARRLTMTLLAELEAVCGEGAAQALAKLGEMMREPDQYGRDALNDAYEKLISLSGRTKTMKDLGDSLKTLVALEREAFSVSVASDDSVRPLSDAMGELAARYAAYQAKIGRGKADDAAHS